MSPLTCRRGRGRQNTIDGNGGAGVGSLPDVIDDEWIDNVEAFEEGASDVFELRYGSFLQDDGSSWQLCEQVLDRDETEKILSSGW